MTTGPLDVVDGTVVIRVHVQPGARRAGIGGLHGDALKVKVTAPPLDGRANEAVAAVLSRTFGVAPAGVELVSGATSRAKRFRLLGLAPGTAAATLGAVLAGPARR